MRGKTILMSPQIKTIILLGIAFVFCSFSNPLLYKINQQQIWKIDKIIYNYKQTQHSEGAIVKSGTEINAGTFILNGDSTGSYSYVIDGMAKKGVFKLSVFSSKTFVFSSGMTKNELIIRNAYTIIEKESNNMEVKVMETTVNQDAQFTLNAMFYLSR